MKTRLSVVLAIFALQANAQNIVSNGSFESYGATLTGWNSTLGYGWDAATTSAADGQTFATITGNLYQDLSTTPGQAYQLRYAVSGFGPSGIVTLQSFWLGNLVASTPIDTAGMTNGTLTWTYVTNTLLATASTTRLWFANANGPNAPAPNLDEVSAIAVDAQPTSCVTVSDGPTSWWKGEGNTLDAADSNYGTLLNGAAFTNGLVGQAFYFAGDNQCLYIPYAATLASSNYSIEAWVQPFAQIADPGTQAVIFAQSKGQCQLSARAGTSGLRLALQFAVDSSSSVGIESTGEIPVSQFSHVAGTWDGASLRLYINGVLDSQGTPGAVPFDSKCPYSVGGIYNVLPATCSPSGNFFNGAIDEVSYYHRALSAGEISSIFRAGTLGKCAIVHPPLITLPPVGKTVYAGSTVTFTANATGDPPLAFQWQFNGSNLTSRTTTSLTLANVQLANSGNYSFIANNAAGFALSSNALLTVVPAPPCVTVTNGLLGWWKAETNLLDGWDSNDGSLLEQSSFTYPKLPTILPVSYVPGKVGQSFNIRSNGVLVADNPFLRMTNGFSIEGWVNPTNLSGSALRTIFAKFDPPFGFTTNSSYYLGASNVFLLLKVSPNGHDYATLVAPQPLESGLWSHLAATYDSSALRLYLNGSLVAQANYSNGVFPGSADASLGAVPYQRNSWYLPWSGYLDEISLYNRALSDSEVLDVYNADLTGKCLAPPLIAIQPQDQAVPLNEDAIFSLKVLGSKPLKYQWRFNGTNLNGATASKLGLERVQSNSIGNYSVVVTNTLGRATSTVAALTLLPPPTCVSAPTGIVAWWPANNFGNDVIGTNNIISTPVFPPSSLFGYSTGKVSQCFSFTNGYAVAANSPDLNINSNADFSIEAWCKAFPTNGLINLSSVDLSIVEKMPQTVIIYPPLPISTAGYSLYLSNGRLACQLIGNHYPQTNIPTFISLGPNIQDGLFHHVAFTFHRNSAQGGCLYVDGQIVLTFDTTQFGTASLSNSGPLYIGSYSSGFIRASGPVQRIDELSIYNRALSPADIAAIYHAGTAGKCIPPPTFPVQPTNQLVQAGATARIVAVSSGFPPLRYQWRKNGTNYPGASVGSSLFPLTIVNVNTSDAGQYSVVASNIGGVVTSAVATLTVNRAPLAGNFTAATVQNIPITIPTEKLLFFTSDPDADPVSLVSIATPTSTGGSFSRGPTDITYTPPNGYIGLDSSTYNVSDGRGGSATALINIQIRSPAQSSGNLLPLTPITGGFRVSFAGIPGRTYTLQRAESVNGPWSNVTAVVVGSLGIATYDDTNSPPPTAFYRTVYP